MRTDISAEYHAELDAELETMCKRLLKIAGEIDRQAAITNKRGFPYRTACRASDAVAALRHALRQDQEHQRAGGEIQQGLVRE